MKNLNVNTLQIQYNYIADKIKMKRDCLDFLERTKGSQISTVSGHYKWRYYKEVGILKREIRELIHELDKVSRELHK